MPYHHGRLRPGRAGPGKRHLSGAHDEVFATRPWTKLEASGEAVGLPAGQMGNSEVGHLNIGAGRVVFQELTRINRACADGSLAANPVLNEAFAAAARPGAALHLMGLVSDGGVHSSNEHLYALARAAKAAGASHIVVHCFMDGRDVPPKSGAGYLDELEGVLAELTDEGCAAEIGSISGRYYAMDRDNRWERVEQAWRAVVAAEPRADATAAEVMAASYAADVTDEFVVPTALTGRGVRDGDAVVFFNFRPDRAREITRAFVDPAFDGFQREYFPVTYVCNTEYDATMPNVLVAFPRIMIHNGLGEYLSKLGLTQLRIAETEKYAHVTFFFNGGVEAPYPGEDRVLVASPKVATYDLQPEMSAYEVTEKCVERIESGAYDVIILNFANCDMVGHTGNYDAAVKAVETVDECVGRVVDATLKMGGIAMITADHGNAEQMLQSDGVSPMTAHTTNPVPFILCGAGNELREGRLADIAPTILDVMGLEKPEEMDGQSLILR